MLSRRIWILLAAGGSAALMLGALGFQYLGDMPPCKLCYWQRYPHTAAVGIGAVALVVPLAGLALLGALAALTTAGLSGYHTGVERSWWEGPSSCSSSSASGLSSDELYEQLMTAPL